MFGLRGYSHVSPYVRFVGRALRGTRGRGEESVPLRSERRFFL